MVDLNALWLPILLSAVLVFIASSVIHMALRLHRNEYKKLAGEENVLAAMRKEGVLRGEYIFPCAPSFKEAGTPEMQKKYQEGPCGFVTVVPSGVPSMAKPLVLWFLYTVVVGIFVAYVAGRTMSAGAEYLALFRVTGTVAILAYAGGVIPSSIWWGKPWSSTIRYIFDGVVYGLLTAGVFGWLWPE